MPWEAADYRAAKRVLGNLDPSSPKYGPLLSRVQEFERSAGSKGPAVPITGQQEGIAGLVSQLGAPQQTDVSERASGQPILRSNNMVAPGGMPAAPSGEGGSGGGGNMPAPSGEGGSGMAGNVPENAAQELVQTDLDLKANERAKAGLGVEAPPEWIPPGKKLGLMDRLPTDVGGKAVYYIEPSLETFRAELALKARGLKEQAIAADQALQTQGGAMAPEAAMQLSGVVQQYMQAVKDANESGAVGPQSASFLEWRNQKWAEFLAKHQQNPDAGPVIRTEHAPTNTFWEKVGNYYQQGKENLTGGLASYLESATVGLSTGPLDAAMGPQNARMVREVRNNRPTADTLGAILGVLTPTGAGGRLATWIAEAGGKFLPKTLAAALAGGETAAIEGTVGDLSHDFLGGYGEDRFNTAHGPSEAEKLAMRMGIGGGLGALGGLMQAGGKRGVQKMNEDDLLFNRPRRDRMEDAGFRPTLTGGIKKPSNVAALGEEAASRGVTTDDILAQRAAGPMLDVNAQRMSKTGADVDKVIADYSATPEGQTFKVSVGKMIRALDDEIAAKTQSTGQAYVGAQREPIEAARWKLFNPEPVDIVPRHEADAIARRYPGSVILDGDAYKATPMGQEASKAMKAQGAALVVPDGHVVILQPNMMTAQELEKQIATLKFTLNPGGNAPPEGQTAQAFKHLDLAARELRDQYPWPKSWQDAGRMPPEEVIQVPVNGELKDVTIRGLSAQLRRAGKARGEAESAMELSNIQSPLPASRQRPEQVRPFTDKLKASPDADEATVRAMQGLAEDRIAREAIELMAGIADARKLAPGATAPTGVMSTSGPRAVAAVSPGRMANSMRSLMLQLAAEDPTAPSAIYNWIMKLRGKTELPSKLPGPEMFGLAPLRVGQGRLGATLGAGYNAQQNREQRTTITPDMLLRELTEEELQLLQRTIEAASKKGTN